MTDVARQLIDDALELAQSRLGRFATHVGGKSWSSNSAAPAVFVRYGAISHGPASSVGGYSPSIFSERQELLVRILGRSDEEAREFKNELLRSLRDTSTEPGGVAPGNFRWVTEDEPGFSRDGAALTGSVVIEIPVPKFADAQQTAVVLHTQFTAGVSNE